MEQVLVVDRAALEARLGGQTFTTEGIEAIRRFIVDQHFFLPRAQAEYDATVKQIIPYVLLRRGDAYFLLRRLKKQNPGAIGALTGCFPQAFPDAAEKIPEADVITGSSNRGALLPAVKEALATGRRVIDIQPHERGEKFEHMAVTGLRGRTRAFVKIEDGCERYCSYCIIPKARGPVRSKPLEEIREELAALARNGYREAVLVGINLSSYGKDLGLRLIDAVQAACRVDGIERVRLGSLEPELLTAEDIRAMAAEEKFCPQFHLALQSGCDKTLRPLRFRGVRPDRQRHPGSL